MPVVIGQSNYSGFGFMTFNSKLLYTVQSSKLQGKVVTPGRFQKKGKKAILNFFSF